MRTPYYLFDADSFIDNYKRLLESFRDIYPNYNIAYSFKTNYTPAVCKIVLELGGYAEVVSDMEYELAKRIGFPADRIIYNGPGKESYFGECIINNGLVNIDNFHELRKVCQLAQNHCNLTVGIRVNFDIGNNLHSRFGIDTCNGDINKVIDKLKADNIRIKGLHFHISRARGIDAWKKRIETIIDLADYVENNVGYELEYIDLGSGMFGDLCEELKTQFGNVPTYKDYASVVAGAMLHHYKRRTNKPQLFTEPGTTLVSRYFSLFAKVLDIKTIRGKEFALLDCSFHNVGEICGLKKVPMKVVQSAGCSSPHDCIDLVGYTCLEQDVMYRNYCGSIGEGDLIEFSNVGGYSIVDKPPFIHPDIPIFMDRNGTRQLVKRAQNIDDIFAPYVF